MRRYQDLLSASTRLSQVLADGQQHVDGSRASPLPRVGLHAAPGIQYVAATLAIWQSGGIVVPLGSSFPPAELSYLFQDAGISSVRFMKVKSCCCSCIPDRTWCPVTIQWTRWNVGFMECECYRAVHSCAALLPIHGECYMLSVHLMKHDMRLTRLSSFAVGLRRHSPPMTLQTD